MRRQYFFPGRPGQGKPACPPGNQVFKICHYSATPNFNSTMNISKHLNKNNREAIDVLFAAQVAWQKGLRPSAGVSRLKKEATDNNQLTTNEKDWI
jgi:hypothetical protein